MAVTPTVAQQEVVHARLTELRHELESLIQRVADRTLSLSQVLELSQRHHPAQFVYLVKIAEAVPGVGKVKARRALEALGYGERTRVGDVPVSGYAALIGALS